jgi:hypothetical protein
MYRLFRLIKKSVIFKNTFTFYTKVYILQLHLLLILKYIYNQIRVDFYTIIILQGDFHFYLDHFL